MQILSKEPKYFLIVLLPFWFMISPVDLNSSIFGDSDISPSCPVLGKTDQGVKMGPFGTSLKPQLHGNYLFLLSLLREAMDTNSANAFFMDFWEMSSG